MASGVKDPAGARLSREPWWATAPAPGQSERDVEWGYLEHYENGAFIFVEERPTDEEIAARKSCRIHHDRP